MQQSKFDDFIEEMRSSDFLKFKQMLNNYLEEQKTFLIDSII